MMRGVLFMLLSCLGSSVLVGAVRYSTREQAPVLPAVRVAVMKADHPDGEPLAAEELGEALVPGELVPDAWLSPEQAAALVGRPCLMTERGAALTASHFAELTWSTRATDCAAAIAPEVNAAADAEVEKALAAFQPREEPSRDVPQGKVLFVARALQAGDTLKKGDLRAGDAPAGLLTASWISADRGGELVGQRLVGDLEEGAPLWWQMLDVEGTFRSCEFEATRVLEDTERRAAHRAAAAWVEKERGSW